MKLASGNLRGPWSITPSGRDLVNAAMRAELPGTLPASSEQSKAPRGPCAVVPIIGVLTKYAAPDPRWDAWLGFTPARTAMRALSEAANDSAVRQIVVYIDSPGGMLSGTHELAELVAQVNKTKPVDAVVSDCCCSAGYLIASQCRSITANRSAEIGSIGVLCVLCDTSAADEDAGLRFVTVASSDTKGQGADGKVTSELISEIQRSVNSHHVLFKDRIVTGRKMNAADVEKLADGRIWLAEQAKSLGLIDRVGAADAAVAQLSANAMPRSSSSKASKPKGLFELMAAARSQQLGR